MKLRRNDSTIAQLVCFPFNNPATRTAARLARSLYPASVASIKREHAQYITDRAASHLVWLASLIKRLEAHQVKPDDPLMRSAQRAYNAMHSLRVHSMYAAMPGGVGEPREAQQGDVNED